VNFFTHAFEGTVTAFGVGKTRVVWYQVLFLPTKMACTPPFSTHPRLRVRGEIADGPVAGAFLLTGDGRRYFIVSPPVRKSAGIGLGSLVEMRFLVDDQNRVDVPDILAGALDRDEDLRARWEQLTPGRRRGLAHLINAARSENAREKRLLSVIDAISE